ncbi:MAG TPA: biotin synthase BioB [Desulfurivibrionaceae bacterium]|nr:biotin synthase BioB [Desulfurivibrionaceae bacterium]
MSIAQDLTKWRQLSLPELMRLALAQKLASRGDRVSLCSIINAKSGKCSEDCRFCAQSSHYQTASPVYPLKGIREVVAAAREAESVGAARFSLVTSGRGPTPNELAGIVELVRAIRAEVPIQVCVSLGIMDQEGMHTLKEAGVSRYHHNLESSREYFPQVATTHTFAERVATIRAAQAAGLEVCAGGIFGLGESEEDRISLALTLKELAVDSVPLNVLMPLPGTPLAGTAPLGVSEILRALALYRLILPAVPIRLAAGRESALTDFLGMAFMAGADGMMIGGYLTQRGRLPQEDQRFVTEILRIWTS